MHNIEPEILIITHWAKFFKITRLNVPYINCLRLLIFSGSCSNSAIKYFQLSRILKFNLNLAEIFTFLTRARISWLKRYYILRTICKCTSSPQENFTVVNTINLEKIQDSENKRISFAWNEFKIQCSCIELTVYINISVDIWFQELSHSYTHRPNQN